MFLGIDISKHNFDAALLGSPGGKPRHRAFPNTEAGSQRLAEWLAPLLGGQRVHACSAARGSTPAWRPPAPTGTRWPAPSMPRATPSASSPQ